MRKEYFSRPGPLAGMVVKPAGAAAFSSSVSSTGRIAAWGQTREQRLHWMQAVGSHWGTWMASRRLSYLEVPLGQVPSTVPNFWKMDTGRLSPCMRSMGLKICSMKSPSSAAAACSTGALSQLAGTST